MDLNQFNCTGRLGRDPEVRYSPSGTAVCSTSMAIGKTYKGEDQTLWIKVTAFGKLAETMGEYCSKGQKVFISGEVQENKWNDREGNERKDIQLIANKMIFLERAKERQEDDPPVPPSPEDNEDIPF